MQFNVITELIWILMKYEYFYNMLTHLFWRNNGGIIYVKAAIPQCKNAQFKFLLTKN